MALFSTDHFAVKYLYAKFSAYLDEKCKEVNHQDVITDLVKRTDITTSYVSAIIFSNLIALLGLLTNSVAVVIGAMLISPLMGPIFSLGLAFSMGDLVLSRRSVRIITFSIVLTVLMASLFTMLSPLNELTHEILVRTRPNIYDLLIAVFAGTAGASALCTRKNYLFTTTGVAVATAVIPPLSVVGYGLGTWHGGIAAGGFLLFFTNLVAIVISSNIVFYIFKFRGSMVAETNYPIRRRFQILGTVLVVISIPLIFTLVTDIRKVKLTGRIEGILKSDLNRQRNSRLTKVAITEQDGTVTVLASINTLKYVDDDIQKKIEQEMVTLIGKPVALELEQVIVRSGAVEAQSPLRAVTAAAPPPPDTMSILREKSVAQLREGCREIEAFIAPYKITGSNVTFSDQGPALAVLITIARDYPSSLQEVRWLKTVLEKKLHENIELKVETEPFLPPIDFTDKNEVSNSSRKALEPLKQIFVTEPAYRLIVEAPIARQSTSRSEKFRLERLKVYLEKELGVPAGHISVVFRNTKRVQIRIDEK